MGTRTSGDRDRQAAVHRALSSPVRSRVLDLLRTGGQAQGVQHLAEQLGLHVNTVRAHLAILEQAGLVASRPEDRGRPGRPRLVYRAAAEGDEAGAPPEEPGYRFLAEVLASYLAATAGDPAGAAEEAGTAWGRSLVERPPPLRSVSSTAAVERLLEMLAELGFAPEVDERETTSPHVLLRRCPFLEVAKEHQQVVCAVHLGLMRGALDELGADVEARDLRPFVEPDLCVADLDVPA